MVFLLISLDPADGIITELLEVAGKRRAGEDDILNTKITAAAVDVRIADSAYVRKITAGFSSDSRFVYSSQSTEMRKIRAVRDAWDHGINPYVRIIEEYIDARFREDISLRDLSELTYLSESYVSSLFKAETGMSIKEYIEERRLEYSRKLLFETDLKVGTIGERAGFRSAAYFCRRFREHYGLPPQRYRTFEAMK